MTEEKAKTKWCPQVKITRGWNGVVLSSRDEQWNAEVGIGCNCIASECMWWVWEASGEYSFKPGDIDGTLTCTEAPKRIGGHCGAIK